MGRFHLQEALEQGLATYAVDPNVEPPSSSTVPLLRENLTERVAFERDDGEIRAHDVEALPNNHPLTRVDCWDIVSPTPSHVALAVAGLAHGMAVLVEKPPAASHSQLVYLAEVAEEAVAGVNYLEMAHPVVRAVGSVLASDGVIPERSLHWRTKNLRKGLRPVGGPSRSMVTLGDMVHDLSEIDYYLECAGTGSLAEADWAVVNPEVTRWSAVDGGRSAAGDAESAFTLDLGDRFTAKLHGSFVQEERRDFVVTNGEDYAVYGNTLCREHIDPVAAVIEGAANVDRLVTRLRENGVYDEQQQVALLEAVDATVLRDAMESHVPESKWTEGQPNYYETPLCVMFQNLRDAEDPSELICPVGRSISYQAVVEEVYRQTGMSLL